MAEWPKELLESFPIHELKSKLINKPLFLIAKSFPHSKLAKLEWRISFSLVELEILLELPYYQRKAFLHLKHCLKDARKIPTYFLKTIFMTLSATYEKKHPQTEWDTQTFYKTLCHDLESAIKHEHIPNFFVPQQNLCELVERRELDDTKKMFGNTSLDMQNSKRGDISITMDNMSDNDSMKLCLTFTYVEIIESIYDMAKWQTSVKSIMRKMMPHKYTDKVRGPFKNLVRINSHFDGTKIDEIDFLEYIRELTLIDSSDFDDTSSKIEYRINDTHNQVVDWIDLIVARIEKFVERNKELPISKLSKEKKFLRNPTHVICEHYLKPKRRRETALLSLGIIIGIALFIAFFIGMWEVYHIPNTGTIMPVIH